MHPIIYKIVIGETWNRGFINKNTTKPIEMKNPIQKSYFFIFIFIFKKVIIQNTIIQKYIASELQWHTENSN